MTEDKLWEEVWLLTEEVKKLKKENEELKERLKQYKFSRIEFTRKCTCG